MGKKNEQIYSIADFIVNLLVAHGFIVQRYNAYKTSSVYIKLDFGVCNSIRISDHPSNKNLQYRYNIIIGGELNIVEETYMRYFYNENTLKELYYQILLDKKLKVQKYGEDRYNSFMNKNRQDHANESGFWKEAKIITSNK